MLLLAVVIVELGGSDSVISVISVVGVWLRYFANGFSLHVVGVVGSAFTSVFGQCELVLEKRLKSI